MTTMKFMMNPVQHRSPVELCRMKPRSVVPVGKPRRFARTLQDKVVAVESIKPDIFGSSNAGISYYSDDDNKKRKRRNFTDSEKMPSDKKPCLPTRLTGNKRLPPLSKLWNVKCKPKVINIAAEEIEESFDCEVCGKQFDDPNYLRKHRYSHVPIEERHKKYECSICSKSFGQKASLDAHRVRHTGVKPFECDICRKRFVGKAGLKKHSIYHTGIKPFACDKCPRRFFEKQNLRSHANVHLELKPFPCTVCGERYSRKMAMQRHARNVHASFDVKRCTCDKCGKVFASHMSMQKHRRIFCRGSTATVAATSNNDEG